MNKTSLKKTLGNIVLLIALTTFALWFALKDDYAQVIANIKQLSIPFGILIIALGIIYYVLQGYILKEIAKKYKKNIRLLDGIDNAYIAAFFNGVTPLGGGQVAQAYAFHKIGMRMRDVASVLWIDFFIYQSVTITYAAVLLFCNFAFAFSTFHAFFYLIIIGFLINSSVIVTLWSMSRFPNFYLKVSGKIVNVLYRMKIVKDKEKTLLSWEKQITYFTVQTKRLKEDKGLVMKAVLINFLRLTIFYAIPYIVAIALHVNLQFSDLIGVIVMSSFIHMLNALTPLPGDTGWTESAFIIIFATMFGKAEASSVMILWRVATYHINILIGALIFMKTKSKKKIDGHEEPIIDEDKEKKEYTAKVTLPVSKSI